MDEPGAAPQRNWLAARGVELALAIGFLTRIPVRQWANVDDVRQADCVWAYSITGLLVGSAGSLLFAVATALQLPAVLAATLAVAATAWISGALHEDGLADFADGIGGGRTRDRKLEIMRDSRIGTYGALALGLTVLLRVEALAALPGLLPLTALPVVHAASRAYLAIPLRLLAPARADGLAQSAGRPDPVRTAVALLAAVAALAAFAVPAVTAGRGFEHLSLLAVVITGSTGVVAVLAVCAIARRHLGGHTGDVFGAAQQAAEVAMLVILVGLVAR